MKLVLTIAWRNILRHRGKSLVIGVILFLGALLMTVGNGVISGMAAGIEKNIVNGFMGDIVLISEKQKSENILLDFMGQAIEPITTYKKIKPVLQNQDIVARHLPVGKNLTLVLKEDEATPGGAFLLGVDFAAYQKMFPDNFRIIEGRWPRPGERGLLVPTFAREEMANYMNLWVIPENGTVIKEHMKKETLEHIDALTVSSNVVMMGMASGMNSTSDIRFPVTGIVKYNALSTIFGHFCIADIDSYRECLGYFTAADKAVAVPKEEQKLLNLEGTDLDSLFGVDPLIVSNTRAPGGAAVPGGAAIINNAIVSGSSVTATPLGVENGIYNLVLVKLKDGVPYKTALGRLNRALAEAQTGVRAITWSKASGPIGSMALIIRGALFVFVTLLFCVAVIIIVNTLTMAALERTSELGMMRAIGARKSFIGGMFLGETAILSSIFGGAGIVAGIAAVKLIPLFKITSTNDMVQILYGGDIFHPLLGTSDVLITLMQLVFVTIIAAVYPMHVAGSITPLDAITRD
ncbi:MAG TPA: FtsX-like permease family protein [Elusimicrobiota bacterium]|nr:FtsX-like permease family protein [Elusimicrobiota bacterium]